MRAGYFDDEELEHKWYDPPPQPGPLRRERLAGVGESRLSV